MSQVDVLTEAQDYLLQVGDPPSMVNLYADVLRELATALPLWSDARTLLNVWTLLALAADGSVSDVTSAAGTGTALSSLVDVSGQYLAGIAKYDTIRYTVGTVQAGGTPVYTYSYWNGVEWLPLTVLTSPNFGVLGVQYLRFLVPQDWVQAPPADVVLPTDFDGVRWWIRVQATTAPTTTAAVAAVQLRQHTFALDSREQAILALVYYPTELTPARVAEALDLIIPTWKTDVGTPQYFTQGEQTALEVRLTPSPVVQGALDGLLGLAGVPGSPQDDNLVVLTAVTPIAEELPEWQEGLVVLRLAAREAERLGETRMPELAQVLRTLSQSLEGMLAATMEEELGRSTPPWRLLVP